MRAGPLSDPEVIRLLNTRFVNTWVLKQELPRLSEKAETGDARRLAKALLDARQPKSPVDCLVLSPQGEVLSVRPVHDLLVGAQSVANYKAFLAGAIASPEGRSREPRP